VTATLHKVRICFKRKSTSSPSRGGCSAPSRNRVEFFEKAKASMGKARMARRLRHVGAMRRPGNLPRARLAHSDVLRHPRTTPRQGIDEGKGHRSSAQSLLTKAAMPSPRQADCALEILVAMRTASLSMASPDLSHPARTETFFELPGGRAGRYTKTCDPGVTRMPTNATNRTKASVTSCQSASPVGLVARLLPRSSGVHISTFLCRGAGAQSLDGAAYASIPRTTHVMALSAFAR